MNLRGIKTNPYLLHFQGSSVHHHQSGHPLEFLHQEDKHAPADRLCHQMGMDHHDLKQK